MQSVRLYKIWPGRNLFYFGGRLMSGPREDWPYSSALFILMSVPPSLFFAYCGDSFGPSDPLVLGIGAFWLLTFSFWLITSFTEPGIIPRKSFIAKLDPATDDNLPSSEPSNSRWCRTCLIVRPPRASHCAECDNCVLQFDHHCPFVNNCVGARNYLFFNLLLLSGFGEGVAVLLGVILSLAGGKENLPAGVLWGVGGALGLLVLLLGGFLIYHCILWGLLGKTTKQHIRGNRVPSESISCWKRPASLLPPMRTPILVENTV